MVIINGYEGWIKLYRSTLKHWIYQDPEALKLWITLLLKASHSTYQQKLGNLMVNLEPGELIFGLESFAFLTDLHRSKVYRLIKLMAEEGLISYDTDSYSAFSLVKINDWEVWQKEQNETPADPSFEVFDGLGERGLKGVRKGSEIDVKGVRKGSEREVITNNNVKNVNNLRIYKTNNNNTDSILERYQKALAEERGMPDNDQA